MKERKKKKRERKKGRRKKAAVFGQGTGQSSTDFVNLSLRPMWG